MGFNRESTNNANRKPKDFTFHITQDDLANKIQILCPLSIKQETYLNDHDNDIIVWGGCASAGKTQLSLLHLMFQVCLMNTM